MIRSTPAFGPTHHPAHAPLQLRRHELQHAWRNSCFHLTPAAFEAAGKKGTGPTPMQELTQILTLDPRYFPQELFGAKDTK